MYTDKQIASIRAKIVSVLGPGHPDKVGHRYPGERRGEGSWYLLWESSRGLFPDLVVNDNQLFVFRAPIDIDEDYESHSLDEVLAYMVLHGMGEK